MNSRGILGPPENHNEVCELVYLYIAVLMAGWALATPNIKVTSHLVDEKITAELGTLLFLSGQFIANYEPRGILGPLKIIMKYVS